MLKETDQVFYEENIFFVVSVIECLKRRAYDQHGLGSKPTRPILLCPWERHFTALSSAWWSWQAVPNCKVITVPKSKTSGCHKLIITINYYLH